jgi:hypothetical protein
VTFTDSVSGRPCPAPWTIVRTWTAIDDSGNSAACQQVITAADDCFCGVGPVPIVGWWRGEGNANSSVGANHGVLQNGATFGAGQVSQAFSLDGANDYVSISDSPSLRPVNLTIEGWFNFGATNDTRTLVSKAVGTGDQNSYLFRLASGVLEGSVSDNNDIAPAVSYAGFQPVPGQGYHLAYTFQDDADTHALYVNGLPVATAANGDTIAYSARPVVLGMDLNSGTPTAFFSGRMDEVSIYSRALTAAEILALFNNGTRSKDYTAPGITCPPNVTAQCDAVTNLALTGSAQAFITDGINDYVSILDSPSLRPDSLTIEGWFKFTAVFPTNTVQILVAKAVGDANTFDNTFAFWVNGSSLRGSVGDLINGYAEAHVDYASFAPQVGLWYHLAYTFDNSTDTENLYVNGQLVATFAQQTRSPVYDSHPVTLAADLNAGNPDQTFSGLLDEVAIYSQALNAG